MKLSRFDINSLPVNKEPISIVLGYFDGVHRGHQFLIETAHKNAKFQTALMTFSRPVISLLHKEKSPVILTSLDDRFRIVSKLGIDNFYVFNIDEKFLNLSPLSFVEILQKMNVKEVFCGSDFHFGKNREGTPEFLKKYFDTKVVDLLLDNNEKISARDMKYLIEQGNIKEANRLLGHNYMMSGAVIHGLGIGRKLGFRTMNIKLSDSYVLPKFGVYKTIAYIEGIPHRSITNVGVKPTVDDSAKVSIEIHVENYAEENYSESIQLEFLDFVRPEMKFSSIEELKAQIASDIEKVFGSKY